ncbi:MAG: hypothetical protein WCH20_16355, partial [Nitrospira sp.]
YGYSGCRILAKGRQGNKPRNIVNEAVAREILYFACFHLLPHFMALRLDCAFAGFLPFSSSFFSFISLFMASSAKASELVPIRYNAARLMTISFYIGALQE